MVLIVPFIILQMTVNTFWLDITAVKVLAQNVTDKFVNSGIVKKDASEKQIVNISMKSQKPIKVKPGRHTQKNVLPVCLTVMKRIV